MDNRTIPRFAPSIPDRVSSRSPEKTKREWELEKFVAQADAKERRKRLKTSKSYDVRFWADAQALAENDLRATRLTRQISMQSVEDKTKDLLEAEEGQKLLLQEKSHELDIRMCKTQGEKVKGRVQSVPGDIRAAFVHLFIGAKTGLNLKNEPGQRDDTLQSSFRADLILKMGSQDQDPRRGAMWCPIQKGCFDEENVVAAHLFPHKAGESNMDAIFGRLRDAEGFSELWKAENGMLWSNAAEKRFSAGYFVIVPAVPDEPSQEDICAWETTHPRQYKIWVLNPSDSSMKQLMGRSEKAWRDLDGELVEFKTDFRPRACYLYFAYCTAMLRRWLTGPGRLEIGKGELCERVWGTPGKYMRDNMLRGFVEEMGYYFEHLMEGAMGDGEDDSEADPTGLVAANRQIRDSLKDFDDEHSDQDDSEDGEEEED
ncbi:hypothetical protein ACLMJK_006317 [Lecanora helva]